VGNIEVGGVFGDMDVIIPVICYKEEGRAWLFDRGLSARGR
jgi:hypothetical protein